MMCELANHPISFDIYEAALMYTIKEQWSIFSNLIYPQNDNKFFFIKKKKNPNCFALKVCVILLYLNKKKKT